MPRSHKGHQYILFADLQNYLMMTLNGKLLQGLFEQERLKPAIIKTDKGNITNLVALKRVMNLGLV